MSIVRGFDKMMNSRKLFSGCNSFVLLLGIGCVSLMVKDSQALRLTNMTAPAVQDPRQDMQLHCRFDMGGEELYAVKWYKDDHEFFRYTPGHSDSVLTFSVPGVNVEHRKSRCTRDACDLLLTDLRRPQSSGAYRCEVSSEAPAFRLASQTHNVTVAALPKDHPVIEGLRDAYLIGDLLIATCTSGLGDPKPLLTFYVNKQQISSKYVKELPARLTEDHPLDDRIKLKNTTIQIRLPLDKKLASNQPSSSLEISCISSVEGINPSVAPPLAERKNVLISDQNELVNNQKLHWPDSGGVLQNSPLFLWVVILAVISVRCC